MNKRIRFIGIAVVGMIALLLPLNADAICGSQISFGAYYSQITNTTNTPTQRSSFWQSTPGAATGNPTVGGGVDNGSIGDSGGGTDWIVPYNGTFGVLGNWAQYGYDGCPDDSATDPAVQRMAVAVSDVVGGVPSFVAMCTDRDTGNQIQFRYDYPNGCGDEASCIDTPLVPIPKPVITLTQRVGNEAQVTVAPPDFSAGYHTDGSTGCEINTIIPQYDVFRQQVARNVAPDGTRDVGPAWVLQGTGNAGVPFVFNTACGAAPPGCDIYLAIAPRYANGFSTNDPAQLQPVRVSVDGTKIQAGPIIANPPKPRLANPKKAGE